MCCKNQLPLPIFLFFQEEKRGFYLHIMVFWLDSHSVSTRLRFLLQMLMVSCWETRRWLAVTVAPFLGLLWRMRTESSLIDPYRSCSSISFLLGLLIPSKTLCCIFSSSEILNQNTEVDNLPQLSSPHALQIQLPTFSTYPQILVLLGF